MPLSKKKIMYGVFETLQKGKVLPSAQEVNRVLLGQKIKIEMETIVEARQLFEILVAAPRSQAHLAWDREMVQTAYRISRNLPPPHSNNAQLHEIRSKSPLFKPKKKANQLDWEARVNQFLDDPFAPAELTMDIRRRMALIPRIGPLPPNAKSNGFFQFILTHDDLRKKVEKAIKVRERFTNRALKTERISEHIQSLSKYAHRTGRQDELKKLIEKNAINTSRLAQVKRAYHGRRTRK